MFVFGEINGYKSSLNNIVGSSFGLCNFDLHETIIINVLRSYMQLFFRGCRRQPLYCFHFDFWYVTLVRYIDR